MNHWIGRYRLVFTEELRAWFRARTSAATGDPTAIEAAMAEAEREALVAEIELSEDGHIASRAGSHEYYRAPVTFEGDRAHFVKPPATTVVLSKTPEGVEAREPDKPAMLFVPVTTGTALD